jgi:predicted nicotinamide N-methyase
VIPAAPNLPRTGLIRLADYQVPTTRELEDREVKRAGVFTFPA